VGRSYGTTKQIADHARVKSWEEEKGHVHIVFEKELRSLEMQSHKQPLAKGREHKEWCLE
jgi:hypothetical protein